MKIQLNYLECRKCGHEWIPRTENVVVCPKCHSYKWKAQEIKNDK